MSHQTKMNLLSSGISGHISRRKQTVLLMMSVGGGSSKGSYWAAPAVEGDTVGESITDNGSATSANPG